MVTTYAQLAKKIDSLKQEAEALKKKEAPGVISRIKDAVEFYGLTAADLGFVGGGKGMGKPAAPKAAQADATKPAKTKSGRPSVIRYRDANGNSWTGMGPKPKWLASGLASGKTLADFEVKPG